MMNINQMLDEQFDKAWDAGVQEAWVIVKDMLEDGPTLDEIKRRFMEELEMKEDE